jgi:ABC-type polysaccharide/polyol phosphate transport system ATPase subunit
MDEMIGAGDQSFIEKAQKRVALLLDRARIWYSLHTAN